MDLTSPRLIYLKGGLFVAAGTLASATILLEHPTWKTAAMLALAVWCFARAYYFAFYVIQHYLDATYRFSGLGSFARYLLRRTAKPAPLLRHEADAPRERSTFGWRYRLLSQGDSVAAWAHVVDIDGSKPHFHRRGTEIYYVLEGAGSIVLDGDERPLQRGSIVHIPPGIVHGAKGQMRVLVVGIPDIDDADLFFPADNMDKIILPVGVRSE